MEKTLDGERAIKILAEIWAEQYGQKIVGRATDEEKHISAVNSHNSI